MEVEDMEQSLIEGGIKMHCSRYKRNCEEALLLCCDVPSASDNREDQLQECKEYIFYEVEDE